MEAFKRKRRGRSKGIEIIVNQEGFIERIDGIASMAVASLSEVLQFEITDK